MPPSSSAAAGEDKEGQAESEEEPKVKRPRKKLAFEKQYLADLPNGERYEKSFMHRDLVQHVVVSKGGFVVTGSADGHVKFWKKDLEGFEFVKHFRAHLAGVQDMKAGFFSPTLFWNLLKKTEIAETLVFGQLN